MGDNVKRTFNLTIMNKKETIKKLIDVRLNTVKRLRLLAAKKETSVKGYIENLIESHVKQNS